MRTIHRLGMLPIAAILLAGCPPPDRPADDDAPPPDQVGVDPADRDPAWPDRDDLRIEVDVAARQLHVYRDDRRAGTHPIAVGTDEWPTRTGEFTIDEVVLNPRWVPPDEEWAEDEDELEPGDPENPLGAAQLVYDRPRSIHGTNEPESIGQAASHGSIRMHDDDIIELARQVMEAAGVDDVEQRISRARRDRDRSETIRLSRGIPITVTDGPRD
jgi:lipoprotein-anchoring transpeptidase ErfK/SrfK